MASTDPDVHFKCYTSADTKIQASIKHETAVKTIHRKTWFHSRLPYSFRCSALGELGDQPEVFVVVVFNIVEHSPQVPSSHYRLVVVQDSVVIKTVNKTYYFHLLLAFRRSAGECTKGEALLGGGGGGLVIPYPLNSRGSYPLSLKLSRLLSPKLLILGI